MRKILLIAVFLLPFLASSQVIVSDDFDSYTPGDLVAATSTNWTTWSGGVAGEDAPVSNVQSFSPTNSMYILDDASDADMILVFPTTYTSGIYEYKMKMYVVSGKAGYFNLQETTTPGIGWQMEALFNANGTGTLNAGGTGAGTFNYTQNAWTDVRVVIDLDSDNAEFYIDNNLFHTWQWSTGNDGSGNANTLGGVNIYAFTNNEYYVDDVIFTDITNPPVVCPVTTVPTVTSGSNCGPGSVTLSATTGGTNTLVVWMDSSGIVVANGDVFNTPILTTSTAFFAADADTFGTSVHVGPDTSIINPPDTAFPGSNFSNGLFFTALTDLRIDSVHLYSNGPLDGEILIRKDTVGGTLIVSAPFSLPSAGYHQVYVGAIVSAGDYFMNLGNLSGTGVLFRTTSGATYPYTVPGVVSITGANFPTSPTRYYYFFDWTVTPACFGPQVPVVATILPANNTLPFFEDFENGLPCNWTTMQNPGSFGWMWGDSASLSSAGWTIPGHTNFMASNDDACDCDMSMDYLITPVFDFSNFNSLNIITLNFEAYYDSSFGSSAYVEVSLDSGITWNVIHTLSPSGNWQNVIVDLSSYAGSPAVQIAFHHDDNILHADGFAVDDVLISSDCTGDELTLNLVTDIFGSEISWTVTDINSAIIYGSGGPYEDINPYDVNAATHNVNVCVPVGATLEWQIDDIFGDGLFDGSNIGYYNLFGPCGELIASGDSAFIYGGGGPNILAWDSLVFTIQPPAINLGADTVICEGTSIVLDAGLSNVTWSTGETTQSITLSNLTPGTWPYYVSTPGGNCFATDTIEITVNPLPVPDFTATANQGTVTFTNASANATTYHWNFGTGNPADTSNATNPTFSYTASDTFTVVLTAVNDCGSASFTLDVVVNIVGIDEIPGAVIAISPNPANELINVSISGITGGNIRLSIVNVLGQQIFSDVLKADGSNNSKIIDVSNYDKGVYFITLQTEQHATTRKLVVE